MCAPTYLEIVSDEGLFERCRSRVLDGEVPTTKDLIAHIHTVTLHEHPGVLVANYCPVGEVYRLNTRKMSDETISCPPIAF